MELIDLAIERNDPRSIDKLGYDLSIYEFLFFL